MSSFKDAVVEARKKYVARAQELPRPRSALPPGRRVPESWIKRNRRKMLPPSLSTSSSLLSLPHRRLRRPGGKVIHKYKNKRGMGPEPMPITVVRKGKSAERVVRRQPRLGWRDYIWSHMHNWHFSGTGPSLAVQVPVRVFRAAKRDEARREHLIRDLEAVSSFRLDLGPLNKMLENIANRKITRADAKDLAEVIVKKAISGCGHGVAPISALRVHSVEGSAKAKEASELEESILQRVYEAIDEDWGPGDSSGDLGPRLRWNMSHPCYEIIISQKGDHSENHRDKETVELDFPQPFKDYSFAEQHKEKRAVLSRELSPKKVEISLNKKMVKTWVERSRSNASSLPGIHAESTTTLSLKNSQLGTISGAEMLADHLFQVVPGLWFWILLGLEWIAEHLRP